VSRLDAGIGVVAAQRILRGELPYVDFQTLYTPGRYYLYAGAFRVFGETFDVATGVDALSKALQAWLAWHLAARLSGSRLLALLAFAAGLGFSHAYPSLAIAFVAVLVAARAAADGRRALVAAAGAAAGVAAWFRQDIGFAAALAVAATLWAGTAGPLPARARRVALAAASAAGALGLLLLPAILAAPARLWQGLVTNPAATVPHRNESVFAVFSAEWVYLAVTLVALAGGVAGLVRGLRSPGRENALAAGAAVLALWSVNYCALRPDAHHVIPAGIMAGVVGGSLLPRRLRLRTIGWSICGAAVLVACGRATLVRASVVTGRRRPTSEPIGDVVPGARTLYFAADEVASYRRLVARVRELVPPDRTFLSACRRHDVVLDQDLVLYFAAGRPAAPYDWHFDPGITTREDVQRGIVADCERARIDVIVRLGGSERDAPVQSAGSRLLDDWIAAQFAPAEAIGRYEIWTRR
jgi:hypothetical protein